MTSISPVQAAFPIMPMTANTGHNIPKPAQAEAPLISEITEISQALELPPIFEILELSSAALAARATYDSRTAQDHQHPASFDRMALVREGFEHTREIFAALSEPSQNELSGMLGQDLGDTAAEMATASGTAGAAAGAIA